jgi:uncharacterized protein
VTINLKQSITADMKNAMRAKEAARLSAVRLLLSAIKQREVDERIELTDTDVVSIIDKMIKQRNDSISQFEDAARQDLVDVEKFEISVLQAYMPPAMSDSEINAAVNVAIANSDAKSPQEMGKVIALLKPVLVGRADMGKVSALVKARLTALITG